MIYTRSMLRLKQDTFRLRIALLNSDLRLKGTGIRWKIKYIKYIFK